MAEKLHYPDMFKVANWKAMEKHLQVSGTGISEKLRKVETAHNGVAGAIVLATGGTDVATKNLNKVVAEAVAAAAGAEGAVGKMLLKTKKHPNIHDQLEVYHTTLKAYSKLLNTLVDADLTKPATFTKVNGDMKKLVYRPPS